MRPTPAELIAQVRRVLRDVVEPEVGSEYARQRLREVRAVLAQVSWDDAGLVLARDTASLRALLAECAEWIGADDARRDHFGALLPELATVAAEPPASDADGFKAYNERHARYAAIAVHLVDPLSDWLVAHPEDETAAGLRRRLLTAP